MDINSLFSKHLIASLTTKDNFIRDVIDLTVSTNRTDRG